jgi:hypothetical protein
MIRRTRLRTSCWGEAGGRTARRPRGARIGRVRHAGRRYDGVACRHETESERLDALGPAPPAELLHVLMLPDFDRADRIGAYYGNPKTRTFAELLIDAEEDPVLRAVLVGMLRDVDCPL